QLRRNQAGHRTGHEERAESERDHGEEGYGQASDFRKVMADKPKILVQLDTDPLPSVFDRIVAVDAGADQVFAYGGVTPDNVRDLVHGCIFTRRELNRTAIFIGGSDLAAGEAVLAAARAAMIPQYGLQVSILLDSNGANTTEGAAVRASGPPLNLAETPAMGLGGIGADVIRDARRPARTG